jgi:uroporphyrin-III C-methyltransferase / precorrin-2 dehydrogenase / sirohydrochlorin ferrochelatase
VLLTTGGLIGVRRHDVRCRRSPRAASRKQFPHGGNEFHRNLHGRVGRRFVRRFVLGDGFVFGRGAEELDACVEAGVPVQVVPGVSSSIAGPAAAGISVTERGVVHDFTVVTGHVPPEDSKSLVDWGALGRSNGTLVLLMAVKNRAAIARALIRGGRDSATPVRIVENATTKNQTVRAATLATLGGTEANHPAVIVVGAVAGRARELRRAAD